MRLNPLPQNGRTVIRLRRNADQRQAGNAKNLIHKFIPILAIPAVVAGIIQFNPAKRLHRFRMAEQEINVLPVDLVPIPLVLVGPGHEEDVSEIHFRTDDGPITEGHAENAVK